MTEKDFKEMQAAMRSGKFECHPTRQEYTPPRVPPQAILDLGKMNPLVGAILNLWSNGDLTWEQALSLMVLELAKRCKRMEDVVTEVELRKPIFVKSDSGNLSKKG